LKLFSIFSEEAVEISLPQKYMWCKYDRWRQSIPHINNAFSKKKFGEYYWHFV